MISDLRIHGTLGTVEYYTYIIGDDVSRTMFYEDTPSHVRFFTRGNEFKLSGTAVNYKGFGGSFCQYMFGVDKPMDDTLRKDVVNRLVMFGAISGAEENILFTDHIEGAETFSRLFLQGHAVANYYFLISSDYKGSIKSRQKDILKSVGKLLKRTHLTSLDDSTELVGLIRDALNETKATIFVFKLVDRNNFEFYSVLRDLYRDDRAISAEGQQLLDGIVRKNNIDEYQKERMKIDVMYRHPENKTVVDEYRDILIGAESRDSLHPGELARLRRLRTLGIRNNIPGILFDTLDGQLLRDKKIAEGGEADYLKESRGIFENLFFKDPNLKKHIINEDIVRLLKAKHRAHEKSDMGFEQIVLDAGKACDELVRETNDFSIFEELSGILTYFDRYDNVSSLLNTIAFTEKVEISEDILRSLIGNKREFEQIQKGLFDALFAEHFLVNKYLTSFGRKRIDALFSGLDRILSGDASVRDVMVSLREIADEERIYRLVLRRLKERIRDIYPRLDVKAGREAVRSELEADLSQKGEAVVIPEKIFEKVVFDIRKEAFYLNHVLPKIIEQKDAKTREDFLLNSGLDRFYIETLEREYLENKGILSAAMEEVLASGVT